MMHAMPINDQINMQTPTRGTVIRANMSHERLIPAFSALLRELDPQRYARLIIDLPELAELPPDSSDWWNTEDANSMCNALFDELNNCATDGCYFGVQPGGDSDYYGFWESESDGW